MALPSMAPPDPLQSNHLPLSNSNVHPYLEPYHTDGGNGKVPSQTQSLRERTLPDTRMERTEQDNHSLKPMPCCLFA